MSMTEDDRVDVFDSKGEWVPVAFLSLTAALYKATLQKDGVVIEADNIQGARNLASCAAKFQFYIHKYVHFLVESGPRPAHSLLVAVILECSYDEIK